MPKVYDETKNVLTAALERLALMFDRFDRVCFSVSGGKDSSVMLQLADRVAREKGKTFDALFVDFEAQYRATIDHIGELKKLPSVGTFYHVALPIALRNAVSVLQPKWCCWDRAAEDLWVRPLPPDAITEANHPFPFFRHGMEFEAFVPRFARWYREQQGGGLVGIGIGIRSDESLKRFLTIANAKSKATFDGLPWTTQVGAGIVHAYPLYDWRTEDVWGAVAKLGLSFNRIYDAMWRNGVSFRDARLCQPYGDDQRNGLDQFRALEADTWPRVLRRVAGVNFGNIYARTEALGVRRSTKPAGWTWERWAVFLLESLGLHNRTMMLRHVAQIKRYLAQVEATPTAWRRIARAIERNDFNARGLSAAKTRLDEERHEQKAMRRRRWLDMIDSQEDTRG